jgi:hypothetical protein
VRRILKLALAPLAFLVVSIAAALPVQADPVLLGPTPYTSSANSPFNGVTFSYFHLENFEDGMGFLNTPGVTGVGGVPQGPGGITDSVDADDGTIDGSGTNGRSYFNQAGSAGITFNFNAATLGGLPTHVGIVWTDGAGMITFEAFGPGGVSLGTVTGNHANFTITGETDEDRFYGVFSSAGISFINIRNSAGGIEVDHLQYGGVSQGPSAVPEPATLLLLCTGLAGIAAKARKRRREQVNTDSA